MPSPLVRSWLPDLAADWHCERNCGSWQSSSRAVKASTWHRSSVPLACLRLKRSALQQKLQWQWAASRATTTTVTSGPQAPSPYPGKGGPGSGLWKECATPTRSLEWKCLKKEWQAELQCQCLRGGGASGWELHNVATLRLMSRRLGWCLGWGTSFVRRVSAWPCPCSSSWIRED